MRRVRASAVLAVALAQLGGCASPFIANWYRVEGKDVYIAILNQGNQVCQIGRLDLNRINGKGIFSVNASATLVPGRLLVRPLKDFGSGLCMIPIDLLVVPVAENCGYRVPPWSEGFAVTLTGVLPNALPEAWEACPEGATRSAEDANE